MKGKTTVANNGLFQIIKVPPPIEEILICLGGSWYKILLLSCGFLQIFVSAPECRDIETALYDHTSVFSELCSIFQYVIKRWLRALQQLSGIGSGEHKSDYGCS